MKWLLKQKYTVEEISKSIVSSDFTVFILLILIVIHLLFFGIREHWFYIVLMIIVGLCSHGLFSTVGLTLGFALIAVYIAIIVRDEYDDILSWNDNTLEGFKRRRRKWRKVKVPKKIPKQVPVVGGRNIPVVGGMGINEAIKKAEAAKRLAKKKAEAVKRLAEKKAREARERAEAAKRLAERKAREARERAEAARRLAERKAREARERAEAAKRLAERKAREARERAEAARRLAEERYRLKVQKWKAGKESNERAVRTNVLGTMNTANDELIRREKERQRKIAERNALIQKQLQKDSIHAPDRNISTQNYLGLQ